MPSPLELKSLFLAEIRSRSYRVKAFRPETNDQGLMLHLDLLQERHDQVEVSMAKYQEWIARYFNRKVQPRSFKVGDWVL